MKTFREFVREMDYSFGRESSNVEDERPKDEIGKLLANRPPKLTSVTDWANDVTKHAHPSDEKPANYLNPQKQTQALNKISDTFQKTTTPKPQNRMDYVGNTPTK